MTQHEAMTVKTDMSNPSRAQNTEQVNGPLPAAIDALSQAIDQTHDELGSLVDQLAPLTVDASSPSISQEMNSQMVASATTMRLRYAVERIEALRNNISSLRERLDVH